MGIEMVSGKLGELFDDGSWVRQICGYLEETMEMTGLVLSITALMLCLQWMIGDASTVEIPPELTVP